MLVTDTDRRAVIVAHQHRRRRQHLDLAVGGQHTQYRAYVAAVPDRGVAEGLRKSQRVADDRRAAAAVVTVFDEPLQAVGEIAGQLYVHDGHLHQHLQRRRVEFFQRELDAGELARRGEDQQRIAVGYRHDPDLCRGRLLAFGSAAAGGCLRAGGDDRLDFLLLRFQAQRHRVGSRPGQVLLDFDIFLFLGFGAEQGLQ